MSMKKLLLALFLVVVSTVGANAQADYAARQRQLSLSAGVMGSAFNPGYQDQDLNGTITNWKFGPGAYVDVHFTHWVQLEAEGRWMRWNAYVGSPYSDEKQDHYLIGPRVPIKRLFGHYDTYGKVLLGGSSMVTNSASGDFFTLALGGTVERKLSRHFTARLADFEYQFSSTNVQVVDTTNSVVSSTHETIHPYGFSVGVSYKIF